jgi:TP901 family phage tail tape measure protein
MGMEGTTAFIKLQALDKTSAKIRQVASNIPVLSRAVDKAAKALQNYNLATKDLQDKYSAIGNKFKDVGGALTKYVTLPTLAAAGLSVKAFADYETALIGVGKTTNTEGAALRAMGDQFRALSKTIPVSVEELLQLGQTAAQLGVKSNDVVKFSETLAKLSRASNIVGEEGASDLARFIQVTGGSIGDVDRFASALVELGNTSAATEAEILSFSLRLGAATSVFNVSSTQALGIATTLKSVGIEAEAGSSSVQRAMGALNDAIGTGGQKMQVLSKLTGIAASDLKDRFKKDAVGVLREFAQGLHAVEKSGGDVTKALDFFGMSGVRDIQVMGTLAKNVGLLDEKLQTASRGFKENTALNKEFNSASKSLANQFQLFKNDINDMAIDLGEKLKPTIVAFFDVVRSGLDFLRNNPTIAKVIIGFTLLLAVVGPLLVAFGTFLTMLPLMSAGMVIFQASIAPLIVSLLIIAAKVAIVVAAIVILWQWVQFAWNNWKVLMQAVVKLFQGDFVGAMDLVVNRIAEVVGKITGAYNAVKKFFGMGGDASVNVNGPKLENSPLLQTEAAGGLEVGTRANRDFVQQTNNARVDLFVRAPENTKIVSEQENGFLAINRGLAGAF